MPDFDPHTDPRQFGRSTGGSGQPPDWLWQMRTRHGGPRGPRIFLAVFLIVGGTLLFLGNLGLLPIHSLWDLVPIGMVVLGAIRLLDSSRASGRFFGGLLVVFGCLFFLVNIGILQIRAKDESWPLSILFIVFGIGLLLKVLESGQENHHLRRRDRSGGGRVNALDDVAVFGSVKRKLDTADFEGGEVRTLFGEVKIDLRRASIAAGREPVRVDATAIFGAIRIVIPDAWRATVHGAGVLGAFEDKTVPPNQLAGAPLLIVTGLSMFGSVEIEN